MSAASVELATLELIQPVGTFYSCSIKAQTLLKMCTFDFRKIEENNGVKDFLGIQRPLNDKRVKEIRKYIATEYASFPTSIVISVDERCATFIGEDTYKKIRLQSFTDEGDGSVVPFTGIGTIIDGQHRLKAFENTQIDWDLSVNILVGASAGTQAMIFSKVNLAQTKVNRSLVYDLFSLDRDPSPEKTAHEIAVNLNKMPESPFRAKIKRLGSATEGVFGETLSQATVVKGLLPYISKDPMIDRDLARRGMSWPDRGSGDFERRIFYPWFKDEMDGKTLATIINYFTAVKERWPLAWEFTGRGAVLTKTNGYNAFIRFLRDAFLHLTSQPVVISKSQFAEIFARSKLKNEDFRVERFVPGSTGASDLYRELLKTLS